MMLFILLVVAFVAKGFVALAKGYHRSPLIYGITGVTVYIVSTTLFCAIIMQIVEIDLNWILFGSYPVGLLTCWLVYSALKRAWSKERQPGSGALDDISHP